MSEQLNIPQGGFPLAPHLVCAGAADAIEFYKKAFGATEMMRLPGPDGRLMHGAVLINGAMVMLVDEMPEHGTLSPRKLGGTPVVIHLTVPDVDSFIDHAVRNGAALKMAPQDMFWGDRYGQVEDPFGHLWSIATHLREPMSEDELKAAAKDAMCGAQPQ